MFEVLLSKRALKDLELLKSANLSKKTKELVDIIKENPFTPPYEKLVGNLQGFYSRRINIKHRMVYKVDLEEKVVLIVSMWTHYDKVDWTIGTL